MLASGATTTPPDTKKKTTKRPAHIAAQSAAPAATSSRPVTKAAPAATTGKSSAVAARAKNGKTARTARVVRSYQQAPTPDRYKEIQQALIAKGYLHGEPSGQWGEDSLDAMKRFQMDQNLTPDGKIGALSLIALGLGPKRLSAQAGPQQAPPDPPK